jgi:hypothetical protein
MKPRTHVRNTGANLTALVVGLTLLGAAGCAEPRDDVETTQSAITGGWTNLVLINGWQNFNTSTYPPAVGIVNGVVTFRGAIKATSPTSDIAFRLDAAQFANFKPQPLNRLFMRALSRTTGGTDVGTTIEFNPLEDPMGIAQNVHVHQDGAAHGVVGTAAKNFTSLEGVAFDKTAGTAVAQDPSVWHSQYGQRQNEGDCAGGADCGAYVKTVDGFVRFQGFLTKFDLNDFGGFLFNVPSTFRPGQTVTVPINLGDPDGSPQSWGALSVYSTGDVFVNGNPPAANVGTSFEGVFFSKTNTGNVNLGLVNSWHAYSARTVKVGKYGEVVRFQGAISGGTTSTIANSLPAGYAPPRTMRLVAAANGPVPATIVVSTAGVVTVEGPPLSVSTVFLSLDGLSYGL